MIYQPYEDLAQRVLDYGEKRADRTGVGTKSLFGVQTEFDLQRGFPLVKSKKVNYTAVVEELLWFLRGETNVRTLNSTIWNEWADADGELGPIYGEQWRDLRYGDVRVDQIAQLVDGIKRDPMSRRHIVSAWNVLALHKMRLTPCHAMFQCYVTTDGFIDLKLFQRSADVALGVPFNIASYATLLSLIARATDLKPRRLIMSFGDVHVYLNHVEALREQILRPPIAQEPRLDISGVPKWCLRDMSDAELLTADQFVIKNYAHHPAIKFPIAV